MAFKMRSPIIKGTKLHKDSIAKAKSNSIVAQTRTSADPNLVTMGDIVGKSKNIGEIDYSLDTGFTAGDYREKESKPKSEKISESISDYGTYQEYVDSHNADKAKMSKEDAEAYGDPISEDEWYSKEEHKNVKRPKREKQEYISIDPRGSTSVRPLPTSNNLVNLQRATGTVNSVEFRDKFEEAAKKAGLPLETLEDYEKAERTLVYDEKLNDWREKIGVIGVGDLKTDKVDERSDEQIKQDEENKIFQEKLDASNYYGVDPNEMTSDGKGGYEPVEGAKHYQYGDTWDAEKGEWRDYATTATYSFPGGKTFKTKEAADKYQAALDKQEEKRLKNIAAKKRNQLIKEAKEHYNLKEGEKLTKSKFEEYKKFKIEEEQMYEDLYEEDSPDPELDAYIANKPDLQVKTNEKPAIIKPKPTDFKDRKNPFGGIESRNDQYRKALKEYYKSLESQEKTSAMQKRDDRIYKNAIKGGVLRKNMIDNGYIIPSKRN